MIADPFILEALVDFPDDALRAEFPITPQHVDAMLAALAEAGVRRVSWATYADGHGGYLLPAGLGDRTDATTYNNWRDYARTLQVLGNPLRVAVEAGHRHGLEVYGYFKPYETGAAMVLPEGSPEAREWGRLRHAGGSLPWIDPFVVQNPALRIRRRTDDGATATSGGPVATLKLIKKDAAPTRITQEHLQIWTSAANYRYERRDVRFGLAESVEPAPAEVRDLNNHVLTRRGDPVRVLTLTGLELNDPYLLVTTDFAGGPADFENTYTGMLRAFAADGREIQGVFANGSAIWLGARVDFRNWGLMFDHGWGRAPMNLDEPNANGRQGFIAFARGRNEYLPGALCETEPRVQEYWLAWVREMLADGVDGVEFRAENHSTQTEFPQEYGFNPAVIERCPRVASGDLAAAVARVRGAAYTDFLRRAKRLIAGQGKRMRVNFCLDFFRPNPPNNRRLAFPANLDFEWPLWVAERIPDEVNLRFYTKSFEVLFSDDITQDMVARCRARNLPVFVNRYIRYDETRQAPHRDEFERVRTDGRFAGFVLYETDAFMKPAGSGGYSITSAVVKAIGRAASDFNRKS